MESDDYGRMYRSVAEDVDPQLPVDFDWLIRAHQTLRRHGKKTCKRSTPLCEVCPLTRLCAWYRNLA